MQVRGEKTVRSRYLVDNGGQYGTRLWDIGMSSPEAYPEHPTEGSGVCADSAIYRRPF